MSCWFIVGLAVFLIGVTKSGFGSGVGLMIVPMTAIALGRVPGRGAEAALGLLLPLLIIGDFIAVWQYRHILSARPAFQPAEASPAVASGDNTVSRSTISSSGATGGLSASAPAPPPNARTGNSTGIGPAALTSILDNESPNSVTSEPPAKRLLRLLLPGTFVGVILGGLLLWWFHQQADLVGAIMRVEIGLESILLVGLHWWRSYKGVQQHLIPEPIRSHITGVFSAISSTLAHAAGPIIAMYLLPLRLDRKLFVGFCAIYFFILNSAKLPAYALSGQFAHAELLFTLRFVPLVVIGALFGLWVNKRMNDRLFSTIVYAITFILGWYILIDGASVLYRHWRQ